MPGETNANQEGERNAEDSFHYIHNYNRGTPEVRAAREREHQRLLQLRAENERNNPPSVRTPTLSDFLIVGPSRNGASSTGRSSPPPDIIVMPLFIDEPDRRTENERNNPPSARTPRLSDFAIMGPSNSQNGASSTGRSSSPDIEIVEPSNSQNGAIPTGRVSPPDIVIMPPLEDEPDLRTQNERNNPLFERTPRRSDFAFVGPSNSQNGAIPTGRVSPPDIVIMPPLADEPDPRMVDWNRNNNNDDIGIDYVLDGPRMIPVFDEEVREVRRNAQDFRSDLEMQYIWSIDQIDVMQNSQNYVPRNTRPTRLTRSFGGYVHPAAQIIHDAVTNQILNPGEGLPDQNMQNAFANQQRLRTQGRRSAPAGSTSGN